MAEIVVGLLGPLIQIAPFIKRQFSYLCCLNSNINSLDEEAKGLDDARAALQQKIDEAENCARVIHSKVLSWMKKVDDIQQRKSLLDTEITKIRDGGCLSVKSRYSVSKRAVKTTAAMKNMKLEDPSAVMTDISHPLPPAATVPDCLQTPTTEFESRKKVEKDLIALLKDEQVNMLGLWGMGGVGKTTLANKIKNKMMKENVFGESVMAVVSQPANMEKIQEDIAGQLGLKFDDHEKSLSSRAPKLCTRLRCKKRIFIVLDDVWEYVDLKELGIPCESGPEGCTILLTSRKRNIHGEMKVLKENVLEMQTLSEDEALSFFQEQLGTSANQFPRLEQQITKECKGLPLALAVVARVLKSQMDINVWEDALGELRRSNPEDLQDFLKEVYNPLKLSYDNLTSNAQSIFLLCSLFPEDFEIPLKDLIAYVVGLRMFKGIWDLETIRTKTYSLVNMLKSCALLLEVEGEEYVRMHDIVRDVAIFIASKDPKEMPLIKSGYNSTWISPFVGGEKIEFSKGSTFPNLHLLLIDKSAAAELQISGISFEGKKKLNVLSICDVWSLTSLPLTTQNLRTLILVNCKSLKTISVVGESLVLEILICRECDVMEEIPLDTLKSLKLLEISDCEALEKIGSTGHQTQHIKILSKLESLQLWNLSNLTDFYQGIESIEFPLLTQLEIKNCPKLKGLVSSPKSVRMRDDGDDHSLHLLCNQKVSFGKLRKLELYKSENCNSILCSCEIPVGSFTHLEELNLSHLPKLKTFCNSALWMPQLLKLFISNCHEMRSFYSGSLNMNNLETLDIQSCCMMEHVFRWSKEENEKGIIGHTITFPKLESLRLRFLPNLTDFYQGIESIKFPSLTQLEIINCQKLKGLVSSPESGRMRDDGDDHSLHLFCNQKVSFGKLRKLRLECIDNCNSIFCSCEIPVGSFTHLQELILFDLPKLKTFCNSALWLPQLLKLDISNCDEMRSFNLGSLTTTSMNNLETLDISSCGMMEHVFLWSEEENEKTITFPKLTDLTLSSLYRLTSICNGVESIEFPLLTRMKIYNCSNLTTLVSADINKVNKQTVYYSLPIWDQQNFTRLEYLSIFGYNEISSLFSSSAAINLINLKYLCVEHCKNMVKVIEEEAGEYSHETLFPHLEQLELNELPKLKFFCGWRCALKLPLLEKVTIYGFSRGYSCPKLSSFSLGSLTTPNLEIVTIDDDGVITNTQGIIDLNNVLQQHFNRKNSTLSEGQEDSKKKGEIDEEEEERNSTSSEGE